MLTALPQPVLIASRAFRHSSQQPSQEASLRKISLAGNYIYDNSFRSENIEENEGTMNLFGLNTKQRTEVHQELRRRILGLDGVTEKQRAGIHEDAFFLGRTMLMHIHGFGHCDIRLSREDQARILAEGKACSHRWAPSAGYVTFKVRDENDLAPAMELIQMSHGHFAREEHK
jgi:Luciferase